MNIEKTVKSLENRGYSVKFFSTADEASAYLAANIKGKSVGFGGSVTSRDMGLYELLGKENEVYWHWLEPGPETIAKANSAEVYISGANAITEEGEILNIDGTGNRLAAQVYGQKKLYIISGTNKICPDFNSALTRAREVACVKNCARLDLNTPCRADGKCHDCRSSDRICNALLVLWAPVRNMECEVILIGEELGY